MKNVDSDLSFTLVFVFLLVDKESNNEKKKNNNNNNNNKAEESWPENQSTGDLLWILFEVHKLVIRSVFVLYQALVLPFKQVVCDDQTTIDILCFFWIHFIN